MEFSPHLRILVISSVISALVIYSSLEKPSYPVKVFEMQYPGTLSLNPKKANTPFRNEFAITLLPQENIADLEIRFAVLLETECLGEYQENVSLEEVAKRIGIINVLLNQSRDAGIELDVFKTTFSGDGQPRRIVLFDFTEAIAPFAQDVSETSSIYAVFETESGELALAAGCSDFFFHSGRNIDYLSIRKGKQEILYLPQVDLVPRQGTEQMIGLPQAGTVHFDVVRKGEPVSVHFNVNATERSLGRWRPSTGLGLVLQIVKIYVNGKPYKTFLNPIGIRRGSLGREA